MFATPTRTCDVCGAASPPNRADCWHCRAWFTPPTGFRATFSKALGWGGGIAVAAGCFFLFYVAVVTGLVIAASAFIMHVANP